MSYQGIQHASPQKDGLKVQSLAANLSKRSTFILASQNKPHFNLEDHRHTSCWKEISCHLRRQQRLNKQVISTVGPPKNHGLYPQDAWSTCSSPMLNKVGTTGCSTPCLALPISTLFFIGISYRMTYQFARLRPKHVSLGIN